MTCEGKFSHEVKMERNGPSHFWIPDILKEVTLISIISCPEMVDVPTTNRQAISTTRICLIMIDYCTSSCLIIILWIPLTLLIAVHFGKPPRKYHTPRKSWDKSPNPQIDLIWILYQIILPGYPMMPASLPWSFLSRFTWLSLASWRFQLIWKICESQIESFPHGSGWK